jgi:hypothetical protein
MVADSNTVDPDSVGVLIDWFHSRFGLPTGLESEAHEVWSHLLFGFSVTYQGEVYAAVPEMVLKHMAYGDNSLISMPLGRRPTLEEVQKNLVSFHGKLNSVFLEHRHDPWFFWGLFEDSNNAKSPANIISDKICDLYLDRYGEDTRMEEWLLYYFKTCTYYEGLLIPPQKRLPPEIFEYAEENFGSMPPRSEEGGSVKIVDSKDMKRLFPQYAAGMKHFCSIIDDYYGWDHRRDYEKGVPQDIRDFITAHEQEILTIFEETERRVEKARSSATTLEPLSPERIEELYNLCVQVDDYIQQQTEKYPHQMTSNEIRKLPMGFLSEIREKFPWPHFDGDKPLSARRADDPQLVFPSRFLGAGASRG